MIERLERGESERAELAAIDGMFRIAFQLDGAAFPGLHVEAAPGRALGTRAGVRRGEAGHLVFRLHQVGDQLLDSIGGTPGQHRGATAGHAEHGQELPPINRVGTFLRHSGSRNK
jgi:hypothetical protein